MGIREGRLGDTRATRLKVPAKRQAEICATMRLAVKASQSAYSMDTPRGELLGVTVERIEILAQDGMLGSTFRRGEM